MAFTIELQESKKFQKYFVPFHYLDWLRLKRLEDLITTETNFCILRQKNLESKLVEEFLFCVSQKSLFNPWNMQQQCWNLARTITFPPEMHLLHHCEKAEISDVSKKSNSTTLWKEFSPLEGNITPSTIHRFSFEQADIFLGWWSQQQQQQQQQSENRTASSAQCKSISRSQRVHCEVYKCPD